MCDQTGKFGTLARALIQIQEQQYSNMNSFLNSLFDSLLDNDLNAALLQIPHRVDDDDIVEVGRLKGVDVYIPVVL